TGLEDRPWDVDKLAAYFAERARGQAGLIITGGFSPNKRGWLSPFGSEMTSRLQAHRHARITEGALTVFAARGYHATAMEEIATAAGVTRSVLYDHFPSKRVLLITVLQEQNALLVEHVGARQPRGPREAGRGVLVRGPQEVQDAADTGEQQDARGDDGGGDVDREPVRAQRGDH
ncbi:TetR family transcriptional regulator, partial [Camelliibacillus cellulosilyticus]